MSFFAVVHPVMNWEIWRNRWIVLCLFKAVFSLSSSPHLHFTSFFVIFSPGDGRRKKRVKKLKKETTTSLKMDELIAARLAHHLRNLSHFAELQMKYAICPKHPVPINENKCNWPSTGHSSDLALTFTSLFEYCYARPPRSPVQHEKERQRAVHLFLDDNLYLLDLKLRRDPLWPV